MKKLLNLLTSFALASSARNSIIACKKAVKQDFKDLTDTFTITLEKMLMILKQK